MVFAAVITRKLANLKAGTAKKTLQATKSAGKAASASTGPSAVEPPTPKTADKKREVAAKAKQAKESEGTPASPATPDSNREQPTETNASTVATLATPETKVVLGAKSAGKKTPGRPKVLASRESAGLRTSKSGEAEQEKVEGPPERDEVGGIKGFGKLSN